ncbi:type-F conjugative transfer system pilin assembly protein TraF [Xenorhabdus ishibashii]|uniref:Conjugal transfer protein TraF n=1 Tax=Xenorhabdus ishibashii TaxID=1034471 RepID=A0A2D0K850_9GAMM|nr:type-F conjugative transfer system pilin assembly protein TraF [Xenorhabdus ishibashii]PHM59562.1 conjugal transfer protein TraF [Xenorhabdus ishibashii]
MKHITTMLMGVLMTISQQSLADVKGNEYRDPVGWQFYNLPEKKIEKEKIIKSVQPEMSMEEKAMRQMKAVQKKLEESKIVAIMNPTTTNIAIYKTYQDFFTEKASVFSSQWEKTLLEYPHLDYNIQNSHYNATATIKTTTERQAQAKAVKLVNQQYGIFFFYRGGEPLDNHLAKIVKEFSQQYDLAIIPISVDGKISSEYPDSKINEGQFETMKVKYLPAVFLVEPKKGNFKPLSYGFISQDDLARRVLNVVTDFKPRI